MAEITVKLADEPEVKELIANLRREIENVIAQRHRLELSNERMGLALNAVVVLRSAGLFDALRRDARDEREVEMVDRVLTTLAEAGV